METEEKPKVRRADQLWFKVLINLLIMCGVGIVIIWIATIWLDSWTHHGQFLVVPEVKGLSYAEAEKKLLGSGFTVELTDSIYDTTTKPGTVVEQNPKVGTKVKDGRLIYVTINAFSPKSVTVPTLTDISLRQAQSTLQGLGINDIVVRMVSSDFKGLVLKATRDGVPLTAGTRIPVNSRVVLEVGDGNIAMNDSLDLEAIPTEQSDMMQ